MFSVVSGLRDVAHCDRRWPRVAMQNDVVLQSNTRALRGCLRGRWGNVAVDFNQLAGMSCDV
jgi:hypothetical protein